MPLNTKEAAHVKEAMSVLKNEALWSFESESAQKRSINVFSERDRVKLDQKTKPEQFEANKAIQDFIDKIDLQYDADKVISSKLLQLADMVAKLPGASPRKNSYAIGGALVGFYRKVNETNIKIEVPKQDTIKNYSDLPVWLVRDMIMDPRVGPADLEEDLQNIPLDQLILINSAVREKMDSPPNNEQDKNSSFRLKMGNVFSNKPARHIKQDLNVYSITSKIKCLNKMIDDERIKLNSNARIGVSPKPTTPPPSTLSPTAQATPDRAKMLWRAAVQLRDQVPVNEKIRMSEFKAERDSPLEVIEEACATLLKEAKNHPNYKNMMRNENNAWERLNKLVNDKPDVSIEPEKRSSIPLKNK